MSWLKRRIRRANQEGVFDQEIAFHLEELTAANIARGMTAAEARRQALLEFGGREQVKQQIREIHSSALFESIIVNLRSAWRFIRRAPSFAMAVILTLAIGIGANSAVFSAIDAVLLRPLPFPHGDELVAVHQFDFKHKSPNMFVAPLRLEDWNRLNSTFQTISGYYTGSATLTLESLPEKVTEAFVAPRFLRLWGISPALGRDFADEEEKFGGPNALLVSDRFWRTHLRADPRAIGKVLQLGGAAYTVVGVMPRSFLFPDRDVDLWTPNPVDAPYSQQRSATWFITLGRLKPGVMLEQAQADLIAVQSQLARQYPKTDADLTVQLETLKSVELAGVQSSLWLLYGSVSVLLLIACTNIAALLMARTAQREHEITIRYSLGASRSAIIGQLLTEVLALAGIGAALGLALAAGASRMFFVFSKDLPRIEEIGLNWRIVAYTLGCALTTTFVCGLIPAIRGSRRNLSGTLAQAGRTQVSSRSPWQWTLVGVQVSLAVALLIGSGLMLRSFEALGRVDPGFVSDHVLTLRINGGWGETVDMGKLTQRIQRTLDGLRAMPGVQAAATSATMPGNSEEYPTELVVSEGFKDPNSKILADTHFVSSGYFGVLRIPVLQGEACRDGSPFNTLVVNRSFANRYFPDSSPIGYHLQSNPANEFMKPGEIRGIVGDAREEGLDRAAQPAVYWCFNAPTPDPNYLIRTHGDPMAMASVVRRKIHEHEPSRSVFNLMPLDDHLNERLEDTRLRTILLTLFALTAISLVSIGLYGTISYLGRMRRREVGLRLALGALPRQIVGLFLLQGVSVTIAGCLIGLLIGAGMSRLLKGMLYGVSALDPATYAGVVLLTVLIAAAASFFPARNGARVDPTEILREE